MVFFCGFSLFINIKPFNRAVCGRYKCTKNRNFSETNIDNRFYVEKQTNYFDKINQ